MKFKKPWIVNIKDIDPLFQVCVLHEFPAIGFCLLKKVKNIFYIFPLTFNGINKNVVKTNTKTYTRWRGLHDRRGIKDTCYLACLTSIKHLQKEIKLCLWQATEFNESR